MAEVTLNPSGDVHIAQILPTANQDAVGWIDVGEYKSATGDARRTLIKFVLTSIPAGSIISATTLRLYDEGSDLSANTRTMKAYRVLRAWTEAGATWNTYDGSNAWGTAGCSNTTTDREATDIGGVEMPATEVEQYYEITLTASKVQEMFDGTLTNNGLILVMDTEVDDQHRFSDKGDVNPPELVITYTPPSGFFAVL